MQPYDLGVHIIEHYALLRHVLAARKPEGVALEFGIGQGVSTRLIAEHMPVVAFGSVEGLPEDWRPDFPKGSFAYPVPDVPNAEIHEGWFDDVLPAFDFDGLERVGLIHLDADLRSSTATALKHSRPCIKPGTILVFDEWFGYPTCEDHEQAAWREFADETGVSWTVLGHSQQAWAIEIDDKDDPA